MARRRPQALIATLVLGLAAGPAIGAWIAPLALACGGVVLVTTRRGIAALAAVALLIAGAAVAQERLHAVDAAPHGAAVAQRVSLHGFVTERTRPSAHGWRARALLTGREFAGASVELRLSRPATAASGSIGDGVIVTGHLRPVAQIVRRDGPSAAGARDYASWLRIEGVDAVIDVDTIARDGRRRDRLTGLFDALRRNAESALSAGLPGQPAALMRGMVLGGDEGFEPQLRTDFRAVGLSHIIAVSGSNVMLLAVLVAALCGAVGLGRRARFALALAAIAVYVPLCGAGASVVRAAVMAVAAIVTLHAGRPVSRLYALLLAAAVVLVVNPHATADVGAQLSFAAVVGLMLFAGPIQRRLRRLPVWLAEAAAATIAATVATIPISAFHFGVFSVVSVAANVLAAPVIGPIVWLGSIDAAVGQIAPSAASLLNAPAGFMLAYLIELSRAGAALPFAQMRLQIGWAAAAGVWLALFAAGMTRPHLAVALTTRVGRGTSRRAIALAAVTIAAVLGVAAGVATTPAVVARNSAIVFLDVGQGDAVMLLGDGGCAALIDGGPAGDGLVAKLRAFGVERLGLVVSTHPAADHDGGLLDLARSGRVRVDRYLAGGLPSHDRSYAELAALLRRQGAVYGEAAAGAGWSCGDLDLQTIGPAPARPGQRPADDPNTRAAVIEAGVGGIGLLTSGDAESPQLLSLPLRREDVLKVPHHGSADPGLAAVVARVAPQVAVIQVGAQNRYGHPTAQAIAALAKVPQLRRTDREGTIVIRGLPK